MVRLDKIFDITYGSQLDLIRCEKCERPLGYNFVNRSEKNCGVSARILEVENKKPFKAGCITSAMGGTVLASFVQQEDFYTGQNVKVLVPKAEMSLSEKLYYCSCIEANRYRFSTFGREANATFDSLLVPEPHEIPDFVKQTNTESENYFPTTPLSPQKIELHTENWRWFRYDEFFEITGSTTTPKIQLEEIGKGDFPYVTTQAVNNGIENFYNFATEKGNILTVDSAVLGFCAYQEKDFSASDHVEKLIPKFNCNIFVALFLTTIINREQYRYNYGRKCSQTKLRNSKILLPATPAGSPDFQFMEDYIKGLPYSRCL